MKKTKPLILMASVLLAMAFTFGCSDDKDDPPPSKEWCVASSGPYVQCTEIGYEIEGLITMTKETCEASVQNNPDMYKLETKKPNNCSTCYGSTCN